MLQLYHAKAETGYSRMVKHRCRRALQLYHAKAETGDCAIGNEASIVALQLYHAKAETGARVLFVQHVIRVATLPCQSGNIAKPPAKPCLPLQLYHAKAETQFPPYHRRQRGTGCNFTVPQQLY